jgi:hypothetical protein
LQVSLATPIFVLRYSTNGMPSILYLLSSIFFETSRLLCSPLHCSSLGIYGDPLEENLLSFAEQESREQASGEKPRR